MTEISTLVTDIYALIQRKDGWFDDQLATSFAQTMASRLQLQLGQAQTRNTLRLSQMGSKCPRALWFSVHKPELAEPLPAWAEIKYSFGHIIETLAITLARAAGHEVTGEQDELIVDGIKGHRDCVIDGCLVDVKSASSIAFRKFKDKTIAEDDSFGYLDQLDGYGVASLEDPLVRVKDKAYLLAIDKQLGHMCLYEHKIRVDSIRARIKTYKSIVELIEAPKCTCGVVPDGKSGNYKLDTKAAYSPFKHCCFPKLRTFLYANGPVYLTHVARTPDVPEIDKEGKIIYSS